MKVALIHRMAKGLLSSIQGILKDKTILVTGGTGSFGQCFTRILTEQFHFKSLRIFSCDELKQHDMAQHLSDERVRIFIGDIRDPDRVQRAVQGVDIIIHAAAMKQVPTCEYNPFEAVKTNILGAKYLIESAYERMFSLPIYPRLRDREFEKVIKAFRAVVESSSCSIGA